MSSFLGFLRFWERERERDREKRVLDLELERWDFWVIFFLGFLRFRERGSRFWVIFQGTWNLENDSSK